MIAIFPKVSMVLAVIAMIFLFLNQRLSAYVVIAAIVILMLTYTILALRSWRCPYCHKYLPTKDAGKITKCPNCGKIIFKKGDE